MHDFAAEQRTTRRFPWVWLTVLSALFIACFYGRLWLWIRFLWDSKALTDYSYYLFIAITAASIVVYIRVHKQALLYHPRNVFTPALALILAGLLTYSLGIGFWLAEYGGIRVQDVGIVLCLVGLPASIAGWKWMRVGWFPIACLALMLVNIWSGVTDPVIDMLQDILQDMTHWLVAFQFKALNLVVTTGTRVDGADIYTHGNNQFQHWIPLNISEGGVGLDRAAMFIVLGLGVAFSGFRWWWQRLMVVLAILPVWFVLNSVRMAAFIIFCENASPKIFAGAPFLWVKMLGTLLLVALAFVILAFWGWVWQYAVINDAESENTPPTPQKPAPIEVPPTRLSSQQILIGLLIGSLSVVLILGLTGYLLQAVAGVLNRGPHLAVVFVIALVLPLCAQFLFRHRRWARPKNQALIWPVLIGGFAAFFMGVLWKAQQNFRESSFTPAVLVQPLSSIPLQAGEWLMIFEDPPLSPDMELELGTNHYLTRYYENTHTTHIMQMHLAYYPIPYFTRYGSLRVFKSGGLNLLYKDQSTILTLQGDWQPDTERGNTAPAGDPLKPWTASLANSQRPARLHSKHLKVSAFTFDSVRPTDIPIHTISFYITDEAYLPTPEDVRWAMQNTHGETRGYFCKVDLTTMDILDREETHRVAAEFLSEMLPHIMACMPN